MKKLLAIALMSLVLTGVGCFGPPGPTDAQSDQWRELAAEFAVHHGPALRAGEDVTESSDLYLEATDLYQAGRYEEAIDKAEESIQVMIDKGY